METSPGTLTATVLPPDNLVLFVREDDWGLKRYPAEPGAELRLGAWEIDELLLTMLIVRIGRSDLTTFDCHIDLGSAPGVRMMQCLAVQPQLELYVVTSRITRSWRWPNPLRLQAAVLVNAARHRPAWEPGAYQAALARLNQLYPTPSSLWWHSDPAVFDELQRKSLARR
ncbi:MAG: hypothetical protein AB1716_06465 [Planctomycetota bacterium]